MASRADREYRVVRRPYLDQRDCSGGAAGLRTRVLGLTQWAFLVLVAVLLYTIAEVTTRSRLTYVLAGCGVAVYLDGVRTLSRTGPGVEPTC